MDTDKEIGLRVMLLGSAGSGKDTMSDLLTRKIGNCHVLSFAAPVKRMCGKMIHYISTEEHLGLAEKMEAMTDTQYRDFMRHFWQWFGTEVGRQTISENFWLNKLQESLADIETAYLTTDGRPPAFVITDCRFLNEYQWGIDNNFVIVRISGDWRHSGGIPNHASEVSHLTLKEHLYFANRGTIKEMEEWIYEVLVPFARDYKVTRNKDV